MKHCFGYIRVSTQKQGEGVSLQAQKDAISDFAANRNLKVVEWFEEKETAAKGGRPVFNRMLRELRRGRAGGLIMHKIDRSARNLKDWSLVSELPDIGVDLYIATETLDFRSRGGRLTADIQAVIAADYIRNLREETIKGLTGRLKQGLYPFRAPLGYLNNGRGKPKTICPVTGPLVRQALELYASGQYSFRSLQAEMNRRGLRGFSGKPLTLHGIEALLRNPFYCGIMEIRATGASYKGIHEPLIDVRTYRRIEDIRTGKAGKKATRHNHLYRGLFRCGLCDRPMSPERQKGQVYYRCQERLCPTKTIREDTLDAAVQHSLSRLRFTPRDGERLSAQFKRWLNSTQRLGDKTSLELQIAKIDNNLDRLTDLLVDSTITKADFERRKRSLTLERADLTEKMQDTTKSDLIGKKLEKFIELMKTVTELHDSGKPEEKRSIVEIFFSNRQVVEKSIYLEPYNWIADRNFSDLSPLVTHVDTLIERLPDPPREPANDNKLPTPLQPTYNSRYQWLDDSQNST